MYILLIKACASHSSLSSLVSGMEIGFIVVGCWITTSGLFIFGSYVEVTATSAGSSSSSASGKGFCLRSESFSSLGSSVFVLIDCLEGDLKGYIYAFTLKGSNSGFWPESLLKVT